MKNLYTTLVFFLIGFIPVMAQLHNHASGSYAGISITTGNRNAFFGANAGRATNTGEQNIFVGQGSGRHNTTGSYNTFIGQGTGYYSVNGSRNTFLGRAAGVSNTNGSYNVYLGMGSGTKGATANYNSYLGYESGKNNISGSANVFLGYKSGFNETGSNKLYIANSDTATPLIYGEFDNNKLQVNGELRLTGGLLVNTITIKLQSDWPDYVFAKDYSLPSLKEVADYIAEYQHLPDLPSAEEIKRDGLVLENIVTRQMTKIEELTLYLLEKDREIARLKSVNQYLQQKDADKDEILRQIVRRLQVLEQANNE